VFEIDESEEGQERRCHFGLDGRTNELILTKPLPTNMSKMNALRFSIAKWEVIAMLCEENHRVETENGHKTCALCLSYWDMGKSACVSRVDQKCPIAMASGQDACRGTPYSSFTNADKEDSYDRQEAAEREVIFLRGLLELAIEEELSDE